ncbi:MAG TPA: FlgD immunoglobulin-like domain containing protein, partial [Candidatus Eisenbacteria bacterium]|nr:FlgD immunoglobulin-like domain containing protein [Candidatus Eisenbacteria bacterium]
RVAAWGNDVLITWKQEIGLGHAGCGFSTDGGQTFTPAELPPVPGWRWAGDAFVAVDEKTGVFRLGGLVERDDASQGIAVVSATLADGTITWGAPVLARTAHNTAAVLSKPVMVADSTTSNLYLACVTFDAAGCRADFQRSTDGGASWSKPAQISSVADGAVLGARLAIGPAGEVYAAWAAIGRGAEDFIRIRTSADQGATWNAPATAATIQVARDGRRDDIASIAVDRTAGTHRGRIHLAWSEGIDRGGEAPGTLGSLVEVENNDVFARANAFTPGQRLRGSLGPGRDLDLYAFSAVEGASYLFACDSMTTPFALRIYCSKDTTVRIVTSTAADRTRDGVGELVWTAPASGVYYLSVMSAGTPCGYRISTGVVTGGPGRARDAGEVFGSYSGDGSTWSAPVRLNDTPARYAESTPMIQVAADGMPYAGWLDWRDDVCGSKTYRYATRSTDGGATWAPSQRISDVQGDAAEAIPGAEGGDLAADARYLRAAWTDTRTGTPEVLTARIDTWHDVTIRQGDLGSDAGTSIHPSWTVANRNPLFANTYGWTLTSQRNWPLTGVGALSVAAHGTGMIDPIVAVPESAAAGVNRMTLTVSNARGTIRRSYGFNVTVQPRPAGAPAMVADAFDLKTAEAASAARLDFSLPYGGPVLLRIYGMRGELIRTLVDGERAAGANAVTWDGRDERGEKAPAGPYVCRLEGFGKVRVQRLVWLR